jgi:hypothetical protein
MPNQSPSSMSTACAQLTCGAACICARSTQKVSRSLLQPIHPTYSAATFHTEPSASQI